MACCCPCCCPAAKAACACSSAFFFETQPETATNTQSAAKPQIKLNALNRLNKLNREKRGKKVCESRGNFDRQQSRKASARGHRAEAIIIAYPGSSRFCRTRTRWVRSQSGPLVWRSHWRPQARARALPCGESPRDFSRA